jgi:hypothetical protein
MTTLFGCGSDPILEKVAELKKEDSSSKIVLEQKGNSSKIGIPKEPKPVQVNPKQVQPKNSAQPPKDEKPKVTISGTVEIIGVGDWNGKVIRIDVFDGDQRALEGPRPKVVSTKRISEQGKFSLFVDKKNISLWLGAYCDVDGDGRPGPKDPSGWYVSNPIDSDQNQDGITILLEIPKEENIDPETKEESSAQ